MGKPIMLALIMGLLFVATLCTRPADVKPIVRTTAAPKEVVAVAHKTKSEEQKRYYDVPLSESLQDFITDICESVNVPERLVYAMIAVESNYEADAISDGGDYGLMQISESNHEWLSKELQIENFLAADENVLAGIWLMASHLEATDGNIQKALMRYNNGPTRAAELWAEGVVSTEYTDKVMEQYEALEVRS